eukprot:364860-Chlamydomonas_euryale.AAC.10
MGSSPSPPGPPPLKLPKLAPNIPRRCRSAAAPATAGAAAVPPLSSPSPPPLSPPARQPTHTCTKFVTSSIDNISPSPFDLTNHPHLRQVVCNVVNRQQPLRQHERQKRCDTQRLREAGERVDDKDVKRGAVERRARSRKHALLDRRRQRGERCRTTAKPNPLLDPRHEQRRRRRAASGGGGGWPAAKQLRQHVCRRRAHNNAHDDRRGAQYLLPREARAEKCGCKQQVPYHEHLRGAGEGGGIVVCVGGGKRSGCGSLLQSSKAHPHLAWCSSVPRTTDQLALGRSGRAFTPLAAAAPHLNQAASNPAGTSQRPHRDSSAAVSESLALNVLGTLKRRQPGQWGNPGPWNLTNLPPPASTASQHASGLWL